MYVHKQNGPSELFDINVMSQESVAQEYFEAGEFDLALAKFQKILTYLKEDLPSAKIPNGEITIYQFKYYYTVPVEIATCQMEMAHCVAALKTFDEIEQNLKDDNISHKAFVAVTIPKELNMEKTTYDEFNASFIIQYDEIIDSYCTKVDLQLRRAECYIRLKDRIKAAEALDIATRQLNTNEFLPQARQAFWGLNHHSDEILGQRVTSAIPALLTTTIPDLQKKIKALEDAQK